MWASIIAESIGMGPLQHLTYLGCADISDWDFRPPLRNDPVSAVNSAGVPTNEQQCFACQSRGHTCEATSHRSIVSCRRCAILGEICGNTARIVTSMDFGQADEIRCKLADLHRRVKECERLLKESRDL